MHHVGGLIETDVCVFALTASKLSFDTIKCVTVI